MTHSPNQIPNPIHDPEAIEQTEQIGLQGFFENIAHQEQMAALTSVSASVPESSGAEDGLSTTYLVSRDGSCSTVTHVKNMDTWYISRSVQLSSGHGYPVGKLNIGLKEVEGRIQKIEAAGYGYDPSSAELSEWTRQIADSVPVSESVYDAAKAMYRGGATTKKQEKLVLRALNQANAAQATADYAVPPFKAPAPNRYKATSKFTRKSIAVAAGVAIAGAGIGAYHMQDDEPKPDVPTSRIEPHQNDNDVSFFDQHDVDTAAREADMAKTATLNVARIIIGDLDRADSGAEIYRSSMPELHETTATHYGNKRIMIGDDLEVGTSDDGAAGPELHAGVDIIDNRMDLFSVAETNDGKFDVVEIALSLKEDSPILTAARKRDLTPEDFASALINTENITGTTAQYSNANGMSGEIVTEDSQNDPAKPSVSAKSTTPGNTQTSLEEQAQWLAETATALRDMPR